MEQEVFPIDLSKLKPLKLDPSVTSLSDETKANLQHNIQLCRDAIVFFTALAGAKGLAGHTGGAYDTVPEVMIVRAFIANGAPIVPRRVFTLQPNRSSERIAWRRVACCLPSR
jgi:hypothetical protein